MKIIIQNKSNLSYGGVLAIMKFFGKLQPWFETDYDYDYPTQKEVAYGYVDGELISASSTQDKDCIKIFIHPASMVRLERDRKSGKVKDIDKL